MTKETKLASELKRTGHVKPWMRAQVVLQRLLSQHGMDITKARPHLTKMLETERNGELFDSLKFYALEACRIDMSGTRLLGGGQSPSDALLWRAAPQQPNADVEGYEEIAAQRRDAPASAPDAVPGEGQPKGDAQCVTAPLGTAASSGKTGENGAGLLGDDTQQYDARPVSLETYQIKAARDDTGRFTAVEKKRHSHTKRGLSAIASIQPLLADSWLQTYRLPGDAPDLADITCGSISGMAARMLREGADRGHAYWLLTHLERVPQVRTAAQATPDVRLGDVLDANTWAEINEKFAPERFVEAARNLLRGAGNLIEAPTVEARP